MDIKTDMLMRTYKHFSRDGRERNMNNMGRKNLALFILIALIASILPSNPVSASSTNELPWPLDTQYGITTGYYYSGGRPHNGVDMAAPSGTPIYANFSGTAEYYQVYTTIGGTNYLTSYGNCVYLTSTDRKYYAIFGHMNAFNGFSLTIPSSRTRQQSGNTGMIAIGSKHVSAGEVLGYVGTTGNSTGNHLHYGLKINGSFVDPTVRLNRNVSAKDSYITHVDLSILASDEDGYMVQCVVENSDLTGELKLASWAETRGTENVKWTSMVEVEKNVFRLYVPFSDHDNIRDKYYNDVYIHYGQANMMSIGRIVFDHRIAYAEEFKVLDSDANGYMVQCIVNDSDITGELVLATWAESRGTEKAVWTKMVEVEKNVFRLYVPFLDHENVRDKYYNDVYMRRGEANEQCLERLLTFDHRLPEAESFEILDSDEGGYMVQCIVNNSDLTGELTLATWAESRGTGQAVWTKMVEVEKNVFKLYVPFSDHGNVRDMYYNDVYMKLGTDEEQCLGRLLPFDHRLIVPYGDPDFILPADIETIKESAFENSAMTIAYIPDGCKTISAYAFKNCKKLTQIRIPVGCTIADTAFYGCNEIYIFGKAGSSAETFCSNHDNCVFIEE